MIALALALAAVQHDGHAMPGMAMPAPPPARRKPTSERKPAARAPARRAAPPAKAAIESCPPEHAAMGHCTPTGSAAAAPEPMPAMSMSMPEAAGAGPASDPCPPEHAAMGHCTPARPAAASNAAVPSGTDLPAGNAPPPSAPAVDYGDRTFGAAMAAPRAQLYREHGGGRLSQVMIDLAEVELGEGRDGYRWNGEGWFGGDRDRLVIKSEGRGEFGRGADAAEVQALFSRAVGPYFNLQGGARQDFGRGPARTYATVGFEGLAPYWFEVEGALFLSDKGRLSARAEAYYDQRITQRLILQPRAELNLAKGDSDLELGLRLRYEIAREFAPYVGVSVERGDTGLVLGLRTWF